MTSVSAVIMAHPDRAEFVARMQSALGVEVPVVWEEGRGMWDTGRRAWEYPTDATHRIVLQDDLGICQDFLAAAERIAAVHPAAPVSFYANRQAVDDARAAGVHWALISAGCWGQALMLPAALGRDFTVWADRVLAADLKTYDGRMAMFLLARKMPVWCTVPSLVEHLGAADSLIGFSNKRRVARWWIGPGVSALNVPWGQLAAVEDHRSTMAKFIRRHSGFIKDLGALRP